MSKELNPRMPDESIDTCELTQPERNRYFHGKLMTARDMAAEQRYTRRLGTRHAQYVAGYGVVEGLTASVRRTEDGLAVDLVSGMAIDCCGRPVVVPADATIHLGDVPTAPRLGLYLEYAECVTESVPIPGSEDACDRECAYNRVVETYDLDVRAMEGRPRPEKPVPSVEFPDPDETPAPERSPDRKRRRVAEERERDEASVGTEERASLLVELEEHRTERRHAEEEGDEDLVEELTHRIEAIKAELAELGVEPDELEKDRDDRDPALARIAAAWDTGDSFPVGCDRGSEGTVFLGSFNPPSGGDPVDVDPSTRPHVYTNDMLYAAISRHTADFTNPHDVTAGQTGALVSVKGVDNPGGDVDLVSPDGNVEFDPDGEARSVGLSVPRLDVLREDFDEHAGNRNNPHQVTAEQAEALVAVNNVDNPGGSVDLISPDESIEIEPGIEETAVGLSVPALGEIRDEIGEHIADTDNPHEVTAAQTGALAAVNDVENPGGSVDLVSPEETISIEALAEQEAVAIDVPMLRELVERIERLEDRVEELEAGDGGANGELRERVDRLEQHVMERSVWTMTHAYRITAERFDIGVAVGLVNECFGFLGEFEGGPIEPEAYHEFIGGTLGHQANVFQELPDAAFPSHVEVLEVALSGLRRVHGSSGGDVFAIADAQTEVCDHLRGVVEREPPVIE